MNTRIPKTCGASILVLCLAAFQSAHAWKVGTHVASGNQVLDDFSATGRTPLDLNGSTTIQFNDPLTGRTLSLGVTKKDALEAIKKWPEYFRGGLIGPDGFPDMATGQMVEHANQAPFIWKGLKMIKTKAPSTIKSYWTNYQVPDALLPTSWLEERSTPSQFRSVDFAMSMFKEAKAYIEPVEVTTKGGWLGAPLIGVGNTLFGLPKQVVKTVGADEQQQILAFIIGYIGHCIGDGMGHTYINEYASGAWDYLDGQGLFGPETEEIKHVVTEGFIDKRVPGSLRNSDGVAGSAEDRYTIAIPVKFLDKFFSTRHASQDVGDRDGDAEEFLAAYTDIDQYYGGPFYSYFNMQVDAGDHIEDWANARGFLDVVEDLDPYVSFLASVDELIESIPGWDKVQEFQNWAKGDLLQSLTFGALNCESPQNVGFFEVWKRLSSIRGNISKWKDHSEIVRRNWLMMSRCTAENLAKINGGKNVNGAVSYHDACAEMADAAWSDQQNASNKSLYRGSIRVEAPSTKLNNETADQEFLRETKESFRGEDVNGQSFEKANQHRLAAANIERAFSYLLGVSITIDDLMEIFSVGSMQPTLDYYCGMADPVSETDEAHRNCFNISKRGELLLLLEGFCLYDAGKDAVKCVTDMGKKWDDCKNGGEAGCRANSLAKIRIPEVCVPRYCKKIFRKKFCIGGGCVGGETITNYVWLGVCYTGVYTGCAVYDVASTAVCEVGTLGDFAGCSLGAIDKAVFTLNPFKTYFRKLDQGCDALTEARKDVALYREFDTKAEREDYLRKRGVPIDQINELKRIWASVMDKIAGLPDTYMLNLVYLKEDLRDGQYVPIVKSSLADAKTRILNANESDKDEALKFIAELDSLVDDIAADRNAFHMPFDAADMSASIDKLSNASTKASLKTRLAATQALVQKAKTNPRQNGLVEDIDAEISLIKSIDLGEASAFNSQGDEQRDAILEVMADLRLFVVATKDGVSFNNYPILRTNLTNLVTSGTKGAGYASRAVDIIVKYVAIPVIPGPTAQKVIAQMGDNLPITFTPFYNTIQGIKTDAVISSTDWSNLFAKAGLSTDLLPWNKPKAKNDQRQIYSSICQDPSLAGWDAVSIYCDVLKSNDDPNCFGCKSPTVAKGANQSWEDYLKGASVYEEVSTGLVWDWTRGIYAWGENGAAPTSYTNFPLSSNAATFSTLYGNIFRNPNCKGSFSSSPSSKEVVIGSSFTLTASLADGSSPAQAYIWLKNGVEIAGGPNPVYTKTNFQASDIGEYWVVAVTSCGTRIASGHALVTKKSLTSIYVDASAQVGGDGSTWTGAFQKLEDAIGAAADNATISIAQGTYQPAIAVGTFALGAGMRLLGGYAPGGSTRDPSLYVTTLSGSYLKPLITIEDKNAELNGLVLAAGSPSEAVAAAIDFYTPKAARSLVVENVRIQGMTSPSFSGTVLSLRSSGFASQLTMSNVRFESNHVSSAVVGLYGGVANFTNIRFEGNNGGVLIYNSGASTSYRNVLMAGNVCQSSSGGVIQNHGTFTADFLTITGNTDPSGVNVPKPSITGSVGGTVRNSIVWDDASSSATSISIAFSRSIAKGQAGIQPELDVLYRPTANSSAKRLADPAEAGTLDLDGVARPSAPDAGALQGP